MLSILLCICSDYINIFCLNGDPLIKCIFLFTSAEDLSKGNEDVFTSVCFAWHGFFCICLVIVVDIQQKQLT